MYNQKAKYNNEAELQKAVLLEKAKGTPDLEIGQKYGVTFRYIERLITKSKGVNISALNVSKRRIKALYPKSFKEEQTTIWSFKQRGKWATHSGEYRGNWSPYIPRNVILKYSKPNDLVLDYFCGAGTTAVEAKLLGRKCVALDINDKAIELARENVGFKMDGSYQRIYEPQVSVGDARDLSFLKGNSVDLICSHPPYANIIHYTDSKEGDLSFFDIDGFLKEMSKVAKESFRVLKAGRRCAILIGDTRRRKHVIPLGFKLINVYLDAGFELRELVIKRQHNCKTTGFWYANSIKYNFLLLAHEYLPIFEKPLSSNLSLTKAKKANRNPTISISNKRVSKSKSDEFETTTVWLLPTKNFEERLDKNVLNRYSKEQGCSVVTFAANPENKTEFTITKSQKGTGLLFIKSPFLGGNPSPAGIESYLKEIKRIVEQDDISKKGFLVVQTRDVRMNGYTEPIAKRIVDTLTLDNLRLKEIVVVTQEDPNSEARDPIDYPKIAHQYLLIYEVT